MKVADANSLEAMVGNMLFINSNLKESKIADKKLFLSFVLKNSPGFSRYVPKQYLVISEAIYCNHDLHVLPLQLSPSFIPG